MILILVFLALSLWAVVATVIELRRDGYRQVPTDWRLVAGRDALDAAESGHVYR